MIIPSLSGCRSSTFSWLTAFSRSGRRPAEDLSVELSFLRAVAQLVLPGKRRDKDVVAQGGASQAGARGKTRGTGCRSECAVGSGDLFDQSSVQLLRSRLGEASSELLRALGGDDGLSTEKYSRPPRVRLWVAGRPWNMGGPTSHPSRITSRARGITGGTRGIKSESTWTCGG